MTPVFGAILFTIVGMFTVALSLGKWLKMRGRWPTEDQENNANAIASATVVNCFFSILMVWSWVATAK